MKDKYFLKKEKVANLLFDLVKYLLTALVAVLLLAEKSLSMGKIFMMSIIAIFLLMAAVIITPVREEEK